MSGRARGRAPLVFIAALALGLLLWLLVIRPGVERGGISEIVLVVAAVVGVLLFERLLRSR